MLIILSIAGPIVARDLLKMGPIFAHYRPNDKVVKEIYGAGGPIYGFRIGALLPAGWSVWFGYSQYRQISKTTYSDQLTTMALNPLTVSVRYTLPLRFFILPYAGVGYAHIGFKEESGVGKIQGNGGSITFDAGVEIKIIRHIYLEGIFRYDRINVNPTGFPVDVGGTQFGGSLIFVF